MPEAFDAYYKWLGIDPEDQPPNHYRLLGIKLFQSDAEVIANAADKQMAHIRSFQTGQHSALSQDILNEIAAARICLLNAAKKAQYDDKLRARSAVSESRPQQAEPFDTSKIGLDFSSSNAASVVKRPRQSHGTKLHWQLPAVIGAGVLASVAIIAYLVSKPPEVEQPGPQAKTDAPSKQVNEGTSPKPKVEKPPRLESKPEVKPKPKPKPEPEREPQPESKPTPQPGLKPESEQPEPVAEAPEKVAERLKEAFGKAKTATDFRAVAVDALKMIDQANTAGKQDVAKSVVMLALSAARKAEDDELAKMATMCVLEPGARHSETDAVLTRQTSHSSSAGQQAAVPDAAAQEQALKLVREVFKDKYSATTSEKQKALSKELLQKAQETTDDAAGQYVMLKEAGRFAMQAKDADLAYSVIEEMGARFEIDAFDLKVKALTAMGKSIGANEQSDAIVESLLALIDEAVRKKKFDVAKQLGATATDLARKSKDTARLSVKAKITEVASLARSYEQVKAAMATLEDQPADPAANLAVGRYLCFARGDWAKGVAMLALGNDEKLNAIAIGELRGAASSDEEAKLADGWWEMAASEKGTAAKAHLQERAKYWYTKALPGATGLARDKIEKRLQAKVESPTESTPRTHATTLEALKKRLRGKVAYDAKTKRFVLIYDWKSENQLKDFDLANAKPVLRQQTLVMRSGDSIRHSVDFTEVTIAVQVRVPRMQGMMIKTSGGAYASVGGAYPDTMYVGIDGSGDAQRFIVPDNQRSGVQPVKLTVEQARLEFAYGIGVPSRLGRAVTAFHAGHLELHGGEVGFQYGPLFITGAIDAPPPAR